MIAWLRGKLAHRRLPRCLICHRLVERPGDVCSPECETALWESRA